MGGGLMQLVAYGAQDIYLTGNPQITFFKVVYRRHTNFSMETIQQTISGSSSGTSGSGTVTISRNGDLISKMYVNAANGTDTCTNGSNIVKEAELEIGGQMIDRHWTEWNNIWNELSTPESKAAGLKAMQGDIGEQGVSGVTTIQVPLNFWFCRNPGLALPLIALQYHEVKVKFTWGGTGNGTVSVLVDYIYLDTDERRRFAQVTHEYLIEQIQKVTATDKSTKLNFNHPIKELIWTGKDYLKAQIKLNGHDRFMKLDEEYFQLRQPFDHHTAVPKQNLPSAAQISVLDRQTTFTSPTLVGGTLVVDDTAANVTAGDGAGAGSDIHLAATGVLTASGTNAAVVVGEFAAGAQLAITILAAGGSAEDFTGGNSGTSGKEPAVGDVYFAYVTKAATNDAGVLTMTISTPTTLDDKTFTAMAEPGSGGSADNSSVRIHLVTNGNSAQARTSQMTEKINVYSFGLKPEEHQPSGTCNFSRIDNAQLVTDATLDGTVYAVNYNVLRIMSGMGGLAYSN